jgi:predicted O-methyltransferase YrrM
MTHAAQQELLVSWIKPYEHEYRGNRTYAKAMLNHIGPGYGYIEAQALHGFIRKTKPKRVIEIGSGISTICILAALRSNQAETGEPFEVTCIEPNPYPGLIGMAIKLIVKLVEQVELSTFDSLQAGDLLFIDSSHAVRPCGDVSRIYLEIFPRLKSGVFIQIHDIYIPYAFGRDVHESYIQSMETALLIAALTYSYRYRILLCMSFMHYTDPEALSDTFPEYRPQPNDGGLHKGDVEPDRHFPSSTYITVN